MFLRSYRVELMMHWCKTESPARTLSQSKIFLSTLVQSYKHLPLTRLKWRAFTILSMLAIAARAISHAFPTKQRFLFTFEPVLVLETKLCPVIHSKLLGLGSKPKGCTPCYNSLLEFCADGPKNVLKYVQKIKVQIYSLTRHKYWMMSI